MLKTPRLSIVALDPRHLEPLRQMRNDPTTWHWLTDVSPISAQQQLDWYQKISPDKTKMYLAIEQAEENYEKGDFVGMLRSDEWDRANRSVRIGIDINPKYRGQGYASEAFYAFIDYLFTQQNIHRIHFLVADANKIATKLYEKSGFKVEGRQREALFRDGKYWDYISMSLLEEEWRERGK